ncbi:MAG: guanitoxin biosynthesis PLP-dependent transaminase GntE, partial [Chloroflexota bacterium]
FNRAMNVMAKGVSSNFRYWGPESTPVAARGKGAKIWDADGHEYIDYRLGWGPIILGHADDRVNGAVIEAIANGTIFATTTELEVTVAEKIVKMVPGMEMLRFTNTGTEATMHALRTARGYTGREKFIKFEGHYHGMHDYVLFSTASSNIRSMGARRSPVPVQVGSGIPKAIRDYVIMLPFNDFEAVERAVKDNYGDIAAMLFEPCMGNVAGLQPRDGYLAHLRKLCDDYGIVMIFDEVKTGFRLANGGARQAYGVIPDLSTYAKSLGNGFPVAVFGGKAEIMDVVGPGSLAHGGTFGGNGASMVAANTVLDILAASPVLENLAKRGQRLKSGLGEILSDADVPHQLTGHPNMQGFLITTKEIHEVRDLVDHNEALYDAIMNQLAEYGVWVEPDAREPWFLCEAHTDSLIDETLNRFQDAVKVVKQGYLSSKTSDLGNLG